jgi:hypothetical protein
VDTGPDYVELLKKDGSFRFERVAPGEYHLVLNARNGFDAPYARTEKAAFGAGLLLAGRIHSASSLIVPVIRFAV